MSFQFNTINVAVPQDAQDCEVRYIHFFWAEKCKRDSLRFYELAVELINNDQKDIKSIKKAAELTTKSINAYSIYLHIAENYSDLLSSKRESIEKEISKLTRLKGLILYNIELSKRQGFHLAGVNDELKGAPDSSQEKESPEQFLWPEGSLVWGSKGAWIQVSKDKEDGNIWEKLSE